MVAQLSSMTQYTKTIYFDKVRVRQPKSMWTKHLWRSEWTYFDSFRKKSDVDKVRKRWTKDYDKNKKIYKEIIAFLFLEGPFS